MRRLGRYSLQKKLRTGGMAEVWLGQAEGPGGFIRRAAIKVILPCYSEDPEFLTMFMDEAAIAAKLTHANIAQVYDFAIEDDTAYMAMEYVDGKDFRTIAERVAEQGKKIPWQVAATMILDLAKGLYYVHTAREFSRPLMIVHRDLSPQNIMLSYTGEVKLVDFGIAHAASRVSVTRAGSVKGKCAYMSPEQAMGHKVDARSDIFSLGVVFWELLTGRRLFAADNDAQTVRNLLMCEIPEPTALEPSIPKELVSILAPCLEKEAHRRYSSLLPFYDRLSAFLFTGNHYAGPHGLAAFLMDTFPEEIAEFSLSGPGDISRPEEDGGQGETRRISPSPQGAERGAAAKRAGPVPLLWLKSLGAVVLALALVGGGVFLWKTLLEMKPIASPPSTAAGPAATAAPASAPSSMDANVQNQKLRALLGEEAFKKIEMPATAKDVQTPERAAAAEEAPAQVVPAETAKEPDARPQVAAADEITTTAETDSRGWEDDATVEVAPAPAEPAKPERRRLFVEKAEPAAVPQQEAVALRREEQQYGTVLIQAKPYASAFLGDRNLGVTPVRVELPAGALEIRLRYLEQESVCRLELTGGGKAVCAHDFSAPDAATGGESR